MAVIAHIGYGYWGKNLARNFAELGCLKAVVDPVPAAAEKAAALYNVKAATFEEVLLDSDINAISIASPAEFHYAHARAALEAGKHVYVEKPLSLKVSDAESLCTLAAERGLRLMVGHLLQYHPIFVELRKMVQAGELGRLLYVYSNRLSLGKFRREENVLWSFAPHDISMILSLFGEEPLHISAQGNISYQPGIADIVTMQMHFPSGSSGHVQVSWMHPVKEQKLVVIGENAMAVFEDSEPSWSSKLKLFRHRVNVAGPVPESVKAEPELIAVKESEPLKTECRHFIECVDQNIEPLTSGEEGLRVLRVLERAEQLLSENLGRQSHIEGSAS